MNCFQIGAIQAPINSTPSYEFHSCHVTFTIEGSRGEPLVIYSDHCWLSYHAWFMSSLSRAILPSPHLLKSNFRVAHLSFKFCCRLSFYLFFYLSSTSQGWEILTHLWEASLPTRTRIMTRVLKLGVMNPWKTLRLRMHRTLAHSELLPSSPMRTWSLFTSNIKCLPCSP